MSTVVATTVDLGGTIIDTNGTTQTWDPPDLTSQIVGGANVPEVTIAAGAQVVVQAASATGTIGYLRVSRTASVPVIVGGAAVDSGFLVPPGGWFIWARGTGSNIYVKNPGVVPCTVAIGCF
jgi:hypothetical protein